MKKYVNIKIEGQGNIGVIDLGKVDAQTPDFEVKIRKTVESKLVKALEEHFDCPVKVRLTEVISTLGHIYVRTTVVVESESEDYVETVEMEETWLY